jgi:hypothetical protein
MGFASFDAKEIRRGVREFAIALEDERKVRHPPATSKKNQKRVSPSVFCRWLGWNCAAE